MLYSLNIVLKCELQFAFVWVTFGILLYYLNAFLLVNMLINKIINNAEDRAGLGCDFRPGNLTHPGHTEKKEAKMVPFGVQ